MYNIKLFEEISDYFKEDINSLNFGLKSLLYNEELPAEKGFLEELEGFLFAKAKRLRPLVVFLIWDMFRDASGEEHGEGNLRGDILNLALAVEILHSATLIHDDIVDMAKLRRGRSAFYLKFDPKIAVLAGDFLLSLAIKTLSKIESSNAVKYFADATIKISKGEIRQFLNKGLLIDTDCYLQKSRDKTGALFICGAKCAIDIIKKGKEISKETENKVLAAIDRFSLGFQIYDDIQNFIETCSLKGLPDKGFGGCEKISSDIENGIYTLPYIYLSHKNFFYDNITKEVQKQAIDFSNRYLNKILNEGISFVSDVKECKVNLLIKLIETFKN